MTAPEMHDIGVRYHKRSADAGPALTTQICWPIICSSVFKWSGTSLLATCTTIGQAIGFTVWSWSAGDSAGVYSPGACPHWWAGLTSASGFWP